MVRCGDFYTSGQTVNKVPIPLTGIAIDAHILGYSAEVTFKQRYHNAEANPIEATYEFELEENAAVTLFSATVDGKVIEAVLKEKEAARNTYDDAIAAGNGAFRMEESDDKRNVFTVSVGALPPGKEVLVNIAYVTECSVCDSRVVFKIPSKPYSECVKEMPPPISSAYDDQFPAAFSVKARIDMSDDILHVECEDHKVSFEYNPGTAKSANVTFVPSNITENELVREFVLRIRTVNPHVPMSYKQIRPDGSAAVMMSFFPEIPQASAASVKTEIIFLVDTSGSMAGNEINQVKLTLMHFLDNMKDGMSFNIVCFNTTHSKLFSSSAVYDCKHKQIAKKFIETIDASGSTNLYDPLKDILATEPTVGVSRQLFILTDGEVDSRQGCIDIVRSQAHTTRVFTFGIGIGVDKDLVFDIAKAGEGRCELIKGRDSLVQKVTLQLQRALKPALTNINLEWMDFAKYPLIKQTPFILPPLFGESRMVIYALIPADDPLFSKTAATLNGKFGDISYSSTLTPDCTQFYPGDHLFKLAARSLIRDLEEGRSQMGPKLVPEVMKAEILSASLKYGVLSKHTAFVAVEKRIGDVSTESMQQRSISTGSKRDAPQKSYNGWGGGGLGCQCQVSCHGSQGVMRDYDPSQCEMVCDLDGRMCDMPPSRSESLISSSGRGFFSSLATAASTVFKKTFSSKPSSSKPKQDSAYGSTRCDEQEKKSEPLPWREEEEDADCIINIFDDDSTHVICVRTPEEIAQAAATAKEEEAKYKTADEAAKAERKRMADAAIIAAKQKEKVTIALIQVIAKLQKSSGEWDINDLTEINVSISETMPYLPRCPQNHKQAFMKLWANYLFVTCVTLLCYPDKHLEAQKILLKGRKWIEDHATIQPSVKEWYEAATRFWISHMSQTN